MPNHKILYLYKLKAFADDNLYVNQKLEYALGKVETLWEKEIMLVTGIFSFPTMFSKKLLPWGREKSGLCGKELMVHVTQETDLKKKKKTLQD